MNITWSELFWLLMAYSFLGWVIETAFGAAKQRRFVNRGLLNGPVCIIYGFAAVLITLNTHDLLGRPILLFLACAIYATIVEWLGGLMIEKIGHARWWDYSGHKLNVDGYVCLRYSLLWGLLGSLSVVFVNPLLLNLYHLIPGLLARIGSIVLFVILLVDLAGSVLVLQKRKDTAPNIQEANTKLTEVSLRLGQWITDSTLRRMEKAHPSIAISKKARKKSTVFAEGLSFYKVALIFIVGSFLGDIVETIFCRVTAGIWMSRSSLVWGSFSIVWGTAMAGATVLLYRWRNRSDRVLFLWGTFLGGAYEYFCSVFTEYLFGTVFWDYSKIPFNLGGRINLLYCFFWGIAAVVWIKGIYPVLSRWIEKLPIRPGKIVTWILVLFMVCDMSVSGLALIRYDMRCNGLPAQNGIEEYLDEHFDNSFIEHRYQNAVRTS